MKLKDKVAIVTGSSRGIGKAIALLFAKEGAKVVVTYEISEKEALTTTKEIQQIGSEAIAVKCNLANENDIVELVRKTIETYKNIDILVNNAGRIIRPGDWKTDKDKWNETLAINLTGHWLLTKECIPHLKLRENSSIINISSYVGQLGSQYVLPYGVAKSGVINMTKAFAKELAPNIRVNSVSPGNIDTDMTKSSGEEFIQKTINNTPLKRLGNPEDIANAVVFLASQEASFITGCNLDVDGGFLLTN